MEDVDSRREAGRKRLLQRAKGECHRRGRFRPEDVLALAVQFAGNPEMANSQYTFRYGQKVDGPDGLRVDLQKLMEQGEKEGWL